VQTEFHHDGEDVRDTPTYREAEVSLIYGFASKVSLRACRVAGIGKTNLIHFLCYGGGIQRLPLR